MSVKNAFLDAVGNKPLTIIPNCGNAGDSLINHSVFSLAKNLGFYFDIMDPRNVNDVDPSMVYLFMANGGLAGDKENLFDTAVRKINGNAKLILFSATIYKRDNLLSELAPDTVIVCREMITFNYVKKLRPDITTLLSEDATMAIADGDASFPKQLYSIAQFTHRLRCLVKSIVHSAPIRFIFNPSSYRIKDSSGKIYLPALRLDGEKTDIQLPIGNVDLSILLSTSKVDPKNCEIAAAYLLNILGRAKFVRTNRLHITIGCCLMATECQSYGNSYFKVKAIYEHSLKRRFSSTLVWTE